MHGHIGRPIREKMGQRKGDMKGIQKMQSSRASMHNQKDMHGDTKGSYRSALGSSYKSAEFIWLCMKRSALLKCGERAIPEWIGELR